MHYCYCHWLLNSTSISKVSTLHFRVGFLLKGNFASRSNHCPRPRRHCISTNSFQMFIRGRNFDYWDRSTVCKRESIGSLNTIIVNKPPKKSFASRTLAAFRPSRVKSVFGLFDSHQPVSAQDLKHQDGLTDNIGDMKVFFRYESSPPHVSSENARPPMSRKKS